MKKQNLILSTVLFTFLGGLAVLTPQFSLSGLTQPGVAYAGGIKINQVERSSFRHQGIINESYPRYQRMEFYNSGPSSQNVNGYKISNRDGENGIIVDSLPNWDVPPGCHLMVHFGFGVDDSDFSDGEGHFYTQVESPAVFDLDGDECALYNGYPSSSTIIDFVAWADTSFSPGSAYGYAIAAGIWQPDDFVDTPESRPLSSIGLCPDGYDHDVSSDWKEFDWGTYYLHTPYDRENAIQISPVSGKAIEEDSLPLTLQWVDVEGALEYRLMIDDDSMFTSPEVDVYLSTTEYTFTPDQGLYHWKVLVVDTSGIIDAAAVWEFVIWPPVGFDLLGVPHFFQHKDTELLCIVDHNWHTCQGPPPPPAVLRPGCDHFVHASHEWDAPHPANHANPPGPPIPPCWHCKQYCARASISMINAFMAGAAVPILSQDYITYWEARDDYGPAAPLFLPPEGDLGHDRPFWLAEVTDAYDLALHPVLPGNTVLVFGKPTFATVKGEIDVGRPVLTGVPNHAIVIDGYITVFGIINLVHVLDPWPGAGTGWFRYARLPILEYWPILPGIAIAPAADPPSIAAHGDGDLMTDFDEDFRFLTNPIIVNTDADSGVNDKNDVRSYTFYQYGVGNVPGAEDNLGFPDVDADLDRAELDTDTDAGGTMDGVEDANDNGFRNAGETDVFNLADDAGGACCGDCNDNNLIDAGDVVYVLAYLYRGGSPPDPLCIGDVNCNGMVDAGDVVYLIGYLFRGGDPPCTGCCDQ